MSGLFCITCPSPVTAWRAIQRMPPFAFSRKHSSEKRSDISVTSFVMLKKKGQKVRTSAPNHAPTPHDLTPRTIAAPFRSIQVRTVPAQLHPAALPAEPDLTSAGFRQTPVVAAKAAGRLQDLVPQRCLAGYLSILSHHFYLLRYARLIQYPVPVQRPKLLDSWSIEMTAPFGSRIGV